jgi:hypothetical protein
MLFHVQNFNHVKAKLLETHGHDLVLLFRLPNLQGITSHFADLALNNLTISWNPPPPITVLRCTISRFQLHDAPGAARILNNDLASFGFSSK